MSDYQHVAVGVMVDERGRVLISQRPQASHQGGLWEFPGGKLEPGESVQQALQRELHEELDIVINLSNCFPLKKLKYHYPEKSVLLDVWSVMNFSGRPRGKEGQKVKWMPINQLAAESFPCANLEIIKALQLPDQIGITGKVESLEDFSCKLEELLARNVKLVQMRQPSLRPDEFALWAECAQALCEKNQARLLVNTSCEEFNKTSAHGLHLNAQRLLQLESRPVTAEQLLGASCHSENELLHAQKIGVDFALLSPVLKTMSHPNNKPLGWDRFREMAALVSMPVYALGGMAGRQLPLARRAGAHGIASISAFWPK